MDSEDTTQDSPRQRIVEAVFRLVERGGLPEASLRKVAIESGMNIGSVRHYFGNHEGLMSAAAEEVGLRMSARIDACSLLQRDRQDAVSKRALLQRLVYALLPDAKTGHAELIVLVECVSAARLHPEFAPMARRMGQDMRVVVRRALELTQVADAEVETERLVALIGGLTFELVYPHGADDSLDAHAVLRHHIASLVPC